MTELTAPRKTFLSRVALPVFSWGLPFHSLMVAILFGGFGFSAATVRGLAAWKEIAVISLVILVMLRAATGRGPKVAVSWIDVAVASLLTIATGFYIGGRVLLRIEMPPGAELYGLRDIAFFPLLSTRSTVVIVLATIVALATHAAMYGPQAAFIAELFSTKLRYSGASMGYQIAGVLGGGIAPLVSIALAQSFGTPFAVSFYVLAMVALTLVALAVAPETARIDLHDEPAARR